MVKITDGIEGPIWRVSVHVFLVLSAFLPPYSHQETLFSLFGAIQTFKLDMGVIFEPIPQPHGNYNLNMTFTCFSKNNIRVLNGKRFFSVMLRPDPTIDISF